MTQSVPKVVLVEDEPHVLRATAELLEEDGLTVIEACDGGSAIACLEAHPDASVLITDIALSDGVDGLSLARSVAERWPHIRIVIVSGAVRPEGRDYPEGALFFTKPYAPKALVTMVKDSAAW